MWRIGPYNYPLVPGNFFVEFVDESSYRGAL